MGFLENKLKYSWNALDGRKEILTTKTITRGWHKARAMNLEENGARLREKSSSVFKSKNDDKKHHNELLRYSGIMNLKVEPTVIRI